MKRKSVISNSIIPSLFKIQESQWVHLERIPGKAHNKTRKRTVFLKLLILFQFYESVKPNVIQHY